uniref:Magnesium transporter n=1 Tax=Alexandrium andersonii TaxID=327968 RepID=A0A7S2MVE8_9DINO|mmetsp:Transcript_76675/g.171537  ORF Transcript_76675/g.171537 Transcript_76675/m.171537 type:complete len:371 (+) Transcript_76675:160-1272(+)
MWLLGVLCCTAGSFFISLGLVLQKYSHLKDRGSGAGSSFYRKPWWILGFSVYIAGQVLNFVAMAWAPQAMLSALGASSLVFLGILGWIILGESMQPLEVCALACVVLGVIMVILAVPEAPGIHNRSVHGVAGNLAEVDFIMAAVGFGAFITASWLSVVLVVPGLTAARGMLWTLMTGVLAGYTFTLWKCVSMLLIGTRHTLVHWQIYIIVAIASCMCVMQVHTLNIALALGSAKAVVPLTFSLGVLIQILNAQVAFEELSSMRRQALFWIGVFLVLVSMACIVQIQLSSEDEEAALEDGDATAALKKGEAEEASMKFGRSQTMGFSGPSPLRHARLGRRHSSYFGIKNDNAAACRGHVYPLPSSGLVVEV